MSNNTKSDRLRVTSCRAENVVSRPTWDKPVETYFPELFAAQCINYEGEVEIVETYAHNMSRVIHDIPQFMKEHIPGEVCVERIADA